MSEIHTLVIAYTGNDTDGWEAEYSIHCPAVSDTCRSWEPCPEADHDPHRGPGVHHGEEHRWDDGRLIRMDRCHLVNDSDTVGEAAEELAVKHRLSPGNYRVRHHFDDGQIDTLTLAEAL